MKVNTHLQPVIFTVFLTTPLLFLLSLYIKGITFYHLLVMFDHVQSIKIFYTNLASNKAHLYWKQSVGIAITFWAQAITIPLERV